MKVLCIVLLKHTAARGSCYLKIIDERVQPALFYSFLSSVVVVTCRLGLYLFYWNDNCTRDHV